MADVLKKVPVREQEPKVRATNFEEVCYGYNKEEAMEEATRCLNCKNARCIQGCPVSINIPAFIAEIKEGNIEEAYKVIGQSSALPAICGRVCPQESQCESKCVRGIKGDAVSIGKLERFVADYALENDIKPEDVDHVLIQSGRRAYGHTSAQCKKYPRNVETCDHSAFYANAVAIKDRKYTINAMDPKNWDDPVVLDLIDRIEAKPTDLIDESGSGGIVDIWTKDGHHYHGMREEAYGMGVTELTYEEIEAKFREMVELRFSKAHTDRLIDMIMNVEKLDDIQELIDMTIIR